MQAEAIEIINTYNATHFAEPVEPFNAGIYEVTGPYLNLFLQQSTDLIKDAQTITSLTFDELRKVFDDVPDVYFPLTCIQAQLVESLNIFVDKLTLIDNYAEFMAQIHALYF
jgi:hypothetical protein